MTFVSALRRRAALLVCLLAAYAAGADAAEIKCICAEAIRPILRDLGPQFEQATGHKLVADYDLAPLVTRKVKAGEAFDLTVLNPPQADELAKEGRIAAETRTNIARTGLGLAVRAGAPKPDISSVEALKRTLLATNSITFPEEGTSGAHFRAMIERLGIAEAMQPKLRPAARGAGFPMLARGEVDLMMTIIPQFLANPGIEVVGPLPNELQSWVGLTGAVGKEARNAEAAKALLQFLKTPEAAALMKAKGWEPVE
jgi:molybdate transport system substrate-binding protein